MCLRNIYCKLYGNNASDLFDKRAISHMPFARASTELERHGTFSEALVILFELISQK